MREGRVDEGRAGVVQKRYDLSDRQPLGRQGGQVREHPAHGSLQRWQVGAEAGVEAVPDLAGGGAVLHRGRVGSLPDQVVQVGGPQLHGPCEADHRDGQEASSRQPGPGPGAADGHPQRDDSGRGGDAGQFHHVRAGRRIPGQRAGPDADVMGSRQRGDHEQHRHARRDRQLDGSADQPRGELYQADAANGIAKRFGQEWIYENDNGKRGTRRGGPQHPDRPCLTAQLRRRTPGRRSTRREAAAEIYPVPGNLGY
jgi:hypothetical protein